jgi:hypothetical protein
MAGKKYSRAFAALTLDYEYVWYGEFEIDEVTFNLIQDKFKNSIPSCEDEQAYIIWHFRAIDQPDLLFL